MKKIYRSKKDKMLGGVCGGIAEYFNIDSSLVRLAAVLLLLFNGFGLLIYILAWFIIPLEPILPGEIVNDVEKVDESNPS